MQIQPGLRKRTIKQAFYPLGGGWGLLEFFGTAVIASITQSWRRSGTFKTELLNTKKWSTKRMNPAAMAVASEMTAMSG
ncbi:hypothetical protein M2405_006128 [Rhodococcus erythropolis]|nr:hypothetical protein [Rhodococcus erythropolis]MCW2425102.1 hypothetical protein [Rhodococcus erythropolis]